MSFELDIDHNPSKMYGKKGFIISKAGEEMTFKQFTDALDLISYSVEHRGCNHYVIVNNRKQWTNFKINSDSFPLRIEVFNDEKAFGQSFSGFFYIYLKEATIRTHDNCDALFISMEGMCLCFSNYDNPLKESDKYMRALPKDYEMRSLCGGCGFVINKTVPVPGLYFLADSMVGMVSPFHSVKCPKGCQSTYSDINFNISNKIYRISTNRPVSEESLKRVYSKEFSELRKLIREEK